jgi:alkyl sulfatase BDS1-like metallo-beta-lactamase superfamily hydrolase
MKCGKDVRTIWVAIGYDLANEILIHTPQGNVIIDPLMSPKVESLAKSLTASNWLTAEMKKDFL